MAAGTVLYRTISLPVEVRRRSYPNRSASRRLLRDRYKIKQPSELAISVTVLATHSTVEAGGEKVRDMRKSVREEETELYLSVINFGEIYYNTFRERGAEKAREIRFIIEQLPVIIVDVDKALTLQAARLKALYPVAYADRPGDGASNRH